MPRKAIKLPDQIDYLSILDESGNLDVALEPKISASQLMRLFRTMLLERHFDQRLLNLQRQGRIGTFPPISGQEAAHLGAVAVLRPSDWLVPAFRETTAEIWRGRSLESIILLNNGFNEGGAIETHRNDLPMAIPVGSQIPHAVGIGYGLKYRRTDDVVMVFFGDGATSQGDFHEALNFAAVFQLPVVFVCQNNQWAISIPRAKQTRTATLAQKAIAYDMPGIQVDGNDILAVYAAADEAVLRARAGDGPTLIESVTYRVTVHTTADDPTRYRSEEEVDLWKARDPLPRFQQYLFDKKLLNAKKLSALEAEVLEEIQTAVDRAEAQMQAPVDPLHMFEHTYAELTPTLREQQQVLADELAASKE